MNSVLTPSNVPRSAIATAKTSVQHTAEGCSEEPLVSLAPPPRNITSAGGLGQSKPLAPAVALSTTKANTSAVIGANRLGPHKPSATASSFNEGYSGAQHIRAQNSHQLKNLQKTNSQKV